MERLWGRVVRQENRISGLWDRMLRWANRLESLSNPMMEWGADGLFGTARCTSGPSPDRFCDTNLAQHVAFGPFSD
jgi:hypothetical protein